MNYTDIFIRRPVLATVVSLTIFVIGLRAIFSLPILQYPHTENAVVTISTTYYGADADVIAGFITTPLENAIAQANGIDYMTSSSINSVSTITANLRLNYDPNKALSEISTKVTSVRNNLPPESQESVITVKVGETIDAMYIGFSSKVLASNYITDYLARAVQPKLQSLEGVQTAELLGARNFALRAWLNPEKMAAYNLTGADINQALQQNNFISGLGNTKGQMVQVNLNAATDLHSLNEFKRLIVKQEGDALVRLEDVAVVSLGADDYESQVAFDGKKAVYIGIQIAPGANLLEVINRVRDIFPSIQAQLPQGIDGEIIYDSTKFVDSSIHEVEHTLIEALIIVTLVIFAFLGNIRSVIIPVVAIPLSLIGAFIFILMFGFTINLLTLLALVLAIGLVVDDAIIVVENVNRHIEEGKSPLDAALIAARELGSPIIAMTIVLLAVYVPIGFQSGLTGALFTEFAFTLVGAVTISAIVALTLSPMMCAKLLKVHSNDGLIDRIFTKVQNSYQGWLNACLDTLAVVVIFASIVLVSIYFLYGASKKELAPQEDQGVIIAFLTAAPNATLEQRLMYAKEVYDVFAKYPETFHVFQLDVPGQSIAGQVLKPWDERKLNANQIQPLVQQQLSNIAGVKAAVFQPPPLPGSSGLPIQFVVQTTESFKRLDQFAQAFLDAVQKTGMFMFVDKDLKIDNPQATVEIDRDKAAQLGFTMSDVGNALSAMLGGGYVNYFSLDGRSYKVIPQVQQRFRLNTEQLDNYYVRSSTSNQAIKLSTIAKITNKIVPESINHFQQLNSATISGVLVPGISMGDALTTMQNIAAEQLPQGYEIDYAGPSRQYIKESSGFLLTFGFAIIIIFLVLAAQFESFRDPFIILVSVPLSIAGALIFICLGVGGSTLNIYTEVGLVTLMGLISKHGILLVQFANKLQLEGRNKRQAMLEAANIRLRPILMTTAAMVLGVAPLLMATGAGAVSRFNMGLVIATGLAIGTLFTLFVVPAFYMLLGTTHHQDPHEEQK